MQSKLPELFPGERELPVALTAAEQKQIRDALCGVAVRGARYADEFSDIRVGLSRQFAQLKADSLKAAKGNAS